jgi:hypothetical protein
MYKDGDNSSMTTPTAMTHEELLELAALDAFGLLDPIEADRYTRSFHDAPATLQDQIVLLQASLAMDESLLPPGAPPADLRRRVLEAVSRAIENETVKYAPIATIGRPRSRSAEIAGRIGLGTSGQMWRAASFFLAAGIVVMAYFLVSATQEALRIASEALSGDTVVKLERMIGPTVTEFMRDPDVQRVVLVPAADGENAWANIYYNERTGEAFLVSTLPAEAEPVYSLTVQTAAGRHEVVGQSFASNGLLRGQRFSLAGVVPAAGAAWQITGPRGIVVRSV